MDRVPATVPAGMTWVERDAALRARLGAVADPQERFSLLLEEARRRPPLPSSLRVDAHRVDGCQVRLWFVPEMRAGACWFQTDSDAVSLKAMTGLLCDLYSGLPPAEVIEHGPALFSDLDLMRPLAENRRRTVWRVRDRMRDFARHQLRGDAVPRAGSGVAARAPEWP